MWTKILAVGPGKRDEEGDFYPTVVKPGQIAIIGPYTDFEEGQRVLIQEGDIRCIIEPQTITGTFCPDKYISLDLEDFQ